jgi:hypothetical protein
VLPLGLVPAGLDQVLHASGIGTETVVLLTVGSVALTIAYERAAVIVLDAKPNRRQLLVGLAAGVVAFLPVPILVRLYILPSIAWLALVGLCVPVVLVEGAGFVESFRRAFRLATADYVHALGSLATLVILYFVTRTVLVLLLQGQGNQTERVALFLGDLAISPLLFVGGALLYTDQVARLAVNSARPRRKEA